MNGFLLDLSIYVFRGVNNMLAVCLILCIVAFISGMCTMHIIYDNKEDKKLYDEIKRLYSKDVFK